METFRHQSAIDDTVHIGVKFQPNLIIEHHLLQATLCNIAEKIAERYVADHYQDVVQHLKPEAIATLVAAESAAEISKTLKEEPRERIREVVKREIYQRGVFGGMSRIR